MRSRRAKSGPHELKLVSQVVDLEGPVEAQLDDPTSEFQRHAMDQLTRLYAPAHLIRTINITYDNEPVLRIESDIALTPDPVITFGFKPSRLGAVEGRGHSQQRTQFRARVLRARSRRVGNVVAKSRCHAPSATGSAIFRIRSR